MTEHSERHTAVAGYSECIANRQEYEDHAICVLEANAQAVPIDGVLGHEQCEGLHSELVEQRESQWSPKRSEPIGQHIVMLVDLECTYLCFNLRVNAFRNLYVSKST